MPLGLGFLIVQNPNSELRKGILASSYPKEFNMSRGLIQKIVKITENIEYGEDDVLEVKYSDKVILIHAKKCVQEAQQKDEVELVIIILGPDEVPNAQEFYDLLVQNIKPFYEQSKQDRTLLFGNLGEKFYQEQASRKMLFLGFPSAGKTCIKKAFFDGADPLVLLGEKAPEPTMGLAHFIYSWLDAEVGIVDSSGQEFEKYVSPGNNFERMVAFEESDIIVYVFDIGNWQKEQTAVIENLEKIVSAKNATAISANIYAFCHKIDLLTGTNQEKAKSFLTIKSTLEAKFGIKVIFTSIQPELIHTLFRSMQILLNDLSSIGNSIEKFCDDVIKEQIKSAVFLLNADNIVISQKATSDLNLDEVASIIRLVKDQRLIFHQTPDFGEMDYSVIHTQRGMSIIVKAVNILKYKVSTIAFLSQNATNRTLTELIEKLDKRLQFENRNASASNKGGE